MMSNKTTLMSIITAQFADANHNNCKTCIPQMPMMRAKEDGARRGSSSQYKEYFVLYAQMRHCMWKRTMIRVYAQIKHSYGSRDMAALLARAMWNTLRSRWSKWSDFVGYETILCRRIDFEIQADQCSILPRNCEGPRGADEEYYTGKIAKYQAKLERMKSRFQQKNCRSFHHKTTHFIRRFRIREVPWQE
jgi:hypothetical protein